MRLRSFTIALVVAGVAWGMPVHAATPFDASLLPFATKSDPRPDPRKINFIDDHPNTQGQYAKRFLTSGAVLQWLDWLARDWPELVQSRRDLDEGLSDLRATIKSDGAILLKVIEATPRDALVKFNGRHDGVPYDALYTLSQSRTRIKDAELEITKAEALIAAANASVDEATAGQGILVSTNELVTLGSRREAIMKQARESGWVREAFSKIKTVVDAVKDPVGAMKTIGIDFVVGSFDRLLTERVLLDHAEELMQIADREEALTKLIANDKLKEVRSKLEAARQVLIAQRLQLVQAAMRRTIAVGEAKHQLNRLSLLEEGDGAGAPKLFRALAKYQNVTDVMAGYVDVSSRDYLWMLMTGPSAKAAFLYSMMNVDVRDVSAWSGDFTTWLERAKDTRRYFGLQEFWFNRQVAEALRLSAAVDGRGHWNLTDAAVAHVLLVMDKGGK